ncbi:MAG: hypothetical protein JO340_01125 [Acidobacteriaceae bacterium]|nr:hypothetical protein [Acidobacteriaceae bacterium]
MSTDAQIAANRANARHSTGPVTDAGKAASCRNNFRHGMAGAFSVLPSEDQDEFDALLCGLRAEHQPATLTESILVQKMAQHYWLSQRAQRLQDLTMAEDLPAKDQDRQFSLFLRYQTTNDRAFHKSLNDLLKLRAEQRRMEIGFESQRQKQASLALRQSAETRRLDEAARSQRAEDRKEQLHKWAVMLAEAKVDHRLDEAARSQRAEDVTRVLNNDLEIDQAVAELAQAARRKVEKAA